MYAYDIRSDWPKTGDAYVLQGEADAGLTYLINHSYPLAIVTNRDDIDQYITQMAIWRYLSLSGKASGISSNYHEGQEAYEGIRSKCETLAKEAVEADKWGYAAAGYNYKKVYIYTRQGNPMDRLLVPLTTSS